MRSEACEGPDARAQGRLIRGSTLGVGRSAIRLRANLVYEGEAFECVRLCSLVCDGVLHCARGTLVCDGVVYLLCSGTVLIELTVLSQSTVRVLT